MGQLYLPLGNYLQSGCQIYHCAMHHVTPNKVATHLWAWYRVDPGVTWLSIID